MKSTTVEIDQYNANNKTQCRSFKIIENMLMPKTHK